jgi:hypothetical protein
MATICYTWDDCPFPWIDTPFTWQEGCIIEKIVNGSAGITKKNRERLRNLDDKEKKILIELFLRLQVDEIVIEKRMNKQKNTKVKIKLKDIVLSEKVQKNISVNVKFN